MSMKKDRRRLLPFGVCVATPQYCHSEPFAVILRGAMDLALSIFNAVRDSSSPEAPPQITPAANVRARHGVPEREDDVRILIHSGWPHAHGYSSK